MSNLTIMQNICNPNQQNLVVQAHEKSSSSLHPVVSTLLSCLQLHTNNKGWPRHTACSVREIVAWALIHTCNNIKMFSSVIPCVVIINNKLYYSFFCLYEEIIYKLLQFDCLPYRHTNHGKTILYYTHQCKSCTLQNILC